MAYATIVKTSVLDSIRRPGFYLTVAVFAAFIVLSHFFTLFTLDQPTSMVREVGVSCIFLCGILTAIFLTATSLASEMESGTLTVLLTKPITRTRVLFAKFTGNTLTVFIALAVLTLDFLVMLAVDDKYFDLLTIQAVVLAFLASALAVASTLLLATFLPFSATILAAFCLFVLGSLSGYLFSLSSGLSTVALRLLYLVVPDYDILNLTNQLSSKTPCPGSAFAWALGYGLAYTCAALLAASIIFRRLEVK